MQSSLHLYDVVRIDHFRAFDTYYAIPYGDKDAVNGEWRKGPGMDFFTALGSRLGPLPVIAEDLGEMFDSVRLLLKNTGYPGMKVMEFGFDSGMDSEYLPHNYPKNCAAYIGTHDNAPILKWLEDEPEKKTSFAREYVSKYDSKDMHFKFIESLMDSSAKTVLFQMQDILGLSHGSRMNTPATIGGNWMWRLDADYASSHIISKLYGITKKYNRC